MRLLLSLLLLCASLPLAASASFTEGEPLPPLTLADGRTLSEVAQGRPLVLLFWASWCPYCKALMPHLQSMLDEYGSERIEVLAISFREDDPQDAQKLLDAQGYDFITELDGDALAAAWGVSGTPRVYLAAADGTLLWDMQAHRSEPNRRFLTTAQNHSGRAARNAPHWAALLRQAIDRQLAPAGEASEGVEP